MSLLDCFTIVIDVNQPSGKVGRSAFEAVSSAPLVCPASLASIAAHLAIGDHTLIHILIPNSNSLQTSGYEYPADKISAYS